MNKLSTYPDQKCQNLFIFKVKYSTIYNTKATGWPFVKLALLIFTFVNTLIYLAYCSLTIKFLMVFMLTQESAWPCMDCALGHSLENTSNLH